MLDVPNSVIQRIAMMKAGNLSSRQTALEYSSAIREYDGFLNTFLSTNPEFMEDSSPGITKNKPSSRSGILTGIPFSVKDLIFTAGLSTTCGSKAPIPESVLHKDQGIAVSRLFAAGAILAGKNNLHEYAFGITNENDHFGPVRNPWNPARMSGGSSGGSAAAVAAGLVPFSIGTDTRGSIRIPCSCCGVTGLKPTYGRIPVSGVVPLSLSLDHIGPITRDAADAELIFSIMLGSAVDGFKQTPAGSLDSGSLKIGVCDYYYNHLDHEVSSAVLSALDFYKGKGVEIREVDLPVLEDALYASDIVSRYEGYAFHRKNLQDYPDGYGEPVARRLASGRDLSIEDLADALKIKEQVTAEFSEAFNEVDCILAPALPVTAPLLGTSELDIEGWKEPIVHGFVRLNAPQNMAGVPCLTLPCGFDSSGLPIGMQLISGRDREEILFSLGKLYQSETLWHQRKPKLSIG